MSETNNSPNFVKTNKGKLAAAGAFLAGLGLVLHGQGNTAPKPEPTGTVEVQPGQTFSDIAEKVAESTPVHETMQQAAENMREINGLPRYPDVAAGQELKVPADADANPELPGVQLNKPAENTELPQPVVPDESGFNTNTPR